MNEKPLPDALSFPELMQRIIEWWARGYPWEKLREVAGVFHTLCFELRDHGLKAPW